MQKAGQAQAAEGEARENALPLHDSRPLQAVAASRTQCIATKGQGHDHIVGRKTDRPSGILKEVRDGTQTISHGCPNVENGEAVSHHLMERTHRIARHASLAFHIVRGIVTLMQQRANHGPATK